MKYSSHLRPATAVAWRTGHGHAAALVAEHPEAVCGSPQRPYVDITRLVGAPATVELTGTVVGTGQL